MTVDVDVPKKGRARVTAPPSMLEHVCVCGVCPHFLQRREKLFQDWRFSAPVPFFVCFFKFFNLFNFWLHWVFVAARGLSVVVASRGYSLLWCAGFSLLWLLMLQSTGSRHTDFSSCGTWAQ